MKFVLERFHKFLKARAKPSDADGSNGFLPGVLIIRRHGENLFEKHLRREVRAARRQFRATIAAQNVPADDRVVSVEPETRARSVGFSSSRSEMAASEELSTTRGTD